MPGPPDRDTAERRRMGAPNRVTSHAVRRDDAAIAWSEFDRIGAPPIAPLCRGSSPAPPVHVIEGEARHQPFRARAKVHGCR